MIREPLTTRDALWYLAGAAALVAGYLLDRGGRVACLPGGLLMLGAAVVQGWGRRAMGDATPRESGEE